METLHPYQVAGVEWLAQLKLALLADRPGLGKTAQAIVAADTIGAENILVLCPAIARINWDREFRKFSPKIRPIHVVTSSKGTLPRNHTIICSYELAVRYMKEGGWEGFQFDILVADEAHFLKSSDAKRTKTVYGKGGLVRKAKRVWALTGTPMPNHPGELWTLLYTFGRTKLSYDEFCERFCAYAPGCGPNDPYPQIVGAKRSATTELRELLAPIMLRRSREGNLPELSFHDLPVEGGRAVLPAADLAKLANLENVADPMRLLEALAGSVSTLRRLVGLQKVQSVGALVAEELSSQQYPKIVIFGVHKEVISQLLDRLAEFGAVAVTGETSMQRRQEYVDRFQTDPKCKVFIGNILAAGTAITLTASDEVLFLEQDFVPGNNFQALKRCHRLGQERPVRVRFAGLADSIDERIASIVRRKTRDINLVFDPDLQATENPFKFPLDENTHPDN